MNLILVNWSQGENDPFTYFNKGLKEKFEEQGCNVFIVEFNNDIAANIKRIQNHIPINLAITHQGIGSSTKLNNPNVNIWEYFNIKLVALHSDHPSHAPSNHMEDSKFVVHAYSNPAFTKYSNKHTTRKYPAITIPVPSFFRRLNDAVETKRRGKYFVFPKNLDDTKASLNKWKREKANICIKYYLL